MRPSNPHMAPNLIPYSTNLFLSCLVLFHLLFDTADSFFSFSPRIFVSRSMRTLEVPVHLIRCMRVFARIYMCMCIFFALYPETSTNPNQLISQGSSTKHHR
jgi:hypothetical protein